MSERQRPDDLRERMQRIAVKRVTDRPPTRPPRAVQSRVHMSPRTTMIADQVRQSRLDTLVAWARWELTVVPGDRWRWLVAVTRPGTPPSHGDTH
jgi:hypothetical protein